MLRHSPWRHRLLYARAVVLWAAVNSVPHAATNSMPASTLRQAAPASRSGAHVRELGTDTSSAARLQILRREERGTRLEWLDAASAEAITKQGSEEPLSPFAAHAGFALTEYGDSTMSYSPDGRFLARVQIRPESSNSRSGVSVISVVDTASGHLLFTLEGQSTADTVQGVSFSPHSSYLVVCSRFRPSRGVPADSNASDWTVRRAGTSSGSEEEVHVNTGHDGSANNNLAIWHLGTARLSGAWCTHHHWDPDRWPYVQWCEDELMGAWALPGSLKLFRVLPHYSASHALEQIAQLQMASPEPCSFSLAPKKPKATSEASVTPVTSLRRGQATLRLAVFKEEADNRRVEILEYVDTRAGDPAAPQGGKEQEGERQQSAGKDVGGWTSLVALPLPGAEDVSLKWSIDAAALLVLSTTHVDETNQNYYGTTCLHLLRRSKNAKRVETGEGEGDAQADRNDRPNDRQPSAWQGMRVVLDRQGPIHDVEWSPKTNEFIVVYGTMPAKSMLYNRNAEAIFSFGAFDGPS